jgi:predicted phage terminase large subunit-like protein
MTPEQRVKRKEEYDERMALIRAGQDADRLKAQERALKALFLLKEHVNGNRVLSEPERVALAGIVVERCIDSFFFFAKHVLEMDLITEQTHKKWADDLQSALYRGKKRMMRLKPRGCYKCLRKGTRISPVGIGENYNVLPANLINQGNFFDEGIKVTMESGRSYTCTKDHMFKTITGWSEAKLGLRVGMLRKIPNPYISIDEGQEYLMGLLVGDGCLRSYTPRLSCADQSTLEKLVSYGFNFRKVGNSKYDYNIIGFSKKIKECGLNGTNSWTKFIPEQYEGSAHFLRGLFDADSSVSIKYKAINYVTVSEKLADDVMRNLLYFGIVARKKYYEYAKTEKSPEHKAYKVTIYSGFLKEYYENIGFSCASKMEKLKQCVEDNNDIKNNPNVDTIPGEWKKLLKPDEKRKIRYELGFRIDNHHSHSREKVRQCGEFLGNEEVIAIANADIFWDKIKFIEEVGEVEFSAIGSDIENYITADGMIHHNTTLYGLAHMLWLWGCVSPQIRIFYTSANSLLLQEVSDKLNQYIGTDKSETLFSTIFGITKDAVAKNTSDVFNIKGRSGKGFSLVFRTSGGSSVGIHPNICIVDDPCFVGETPVLTINGYVPIKDIKAGDQVLTRFGFKKVLRSWKTRKNADVADYNINEKILTCTANHKIITGNGKKEISLLDNDIITKFVNDIWMSEIVETSIITNKRKSDVYNLTVEDVHEFVANGILVSNCDQNDRDSDTTRQGKARWFDGLTPLLVPFFDPKTGISLETILYIGTHWHLRDLIWHIEETNKKLPEDSKWDIESESVFTEDRQARYPEFFPLSKIMEIKANISDVFFACQYENLPMSEGMQVFDLKKLFFTRKDQIEADKGEMLCVFDPSLGKTHSDYAAVWWLHFHNNKITILDAIDDKVELNLIVHQIANKNMEYGCRHMIYENNGISLVEESLKSAHNRLNWRIHIEGLHHSSNKDERIMSMQPALYSGQVQFMSDYEIRYPEAMAQLIFYPVYGHDDFPDCLQMGIEHFKQARFQFIRYEELL